MDKIWYDYDKNNITNKNTKINYIVYCINYNEKEKKYEKYKCSDFIIIKIKL